MAAHSELSSTANDVFTRRHLKLSELPLSGSKRADVDVLVQKMKKRGFFDLLRKQGYQKFDTGGSKEVLLSSLQGLVDTETTRDPSLLAKDRRIAASLIEGTAERGDIYKAAEDSIQAFVQDLVVQAKEQLRSIRHQDVGERVAAEEERRGRKTDEEWDREASERRQVRAQAREDEKEAARRKERDERKRAEDQRRRRKDEEELREAQRLKEREEREEHRRLDREAEREREKERERKRRRDIEREEEEYEREREERRERRRREERARDAHTKQELSVHEWSSHEATSKQEKGAGNAQEKDLDEVALLQLLKEGQEAAKSRQRPELDRSQDLLPPPARKLPASRPARSRDVADVARHTKLEPNSLAGEDERRQSVTMNAGTLSSVVNEPADDEGEIHTSSQIETSSLRAADGQYQADKSRNTGRAAQNDQMVLGADKSRAANGEREHRIRRQIERRSRSPESRYAERRYRRRETSRSRSVDKRRGYRDRSPRKPRSTSPPAIDRYVPGAGSRNHNRDHDRDRDGRRDARDASREKGRDRRRESSAGYETPYQGRDRRQNRDDRTRVDSRERGHRDREYRDARPQSRDRRRQQSADRHAGPRRGQEERQEARAEDNKHKYVEIDRYIPSKDRSDSRNRDRDRDAGDARSKDSGRHQARDRSRTGDYNRPRDSEGGRERHRDRDRYDVDRPRRNHRSRS